MDQKLLKGNNICRTCLNEASTYKSLLSKMETDDRTLCEVLSFITSVDISINDKYPRQVCGECFIVMCKADAFKKRCIQSESVLKNALFDSYTVKNELHCTKLDTTAPLDNQNNDYLNFFNSADTKVVEIPVIDNLDLGELKYNNLDNIKEEDEDDDDDYIEDEMEDVSDSIVVENDQVSDTKTSLTKVCICGCVCAEIDFESHVKECKLHSKPETKLKTEPTHQEGEKIDLNCPICKEKFAYWGLYTAHLKKHKSLVSDGLKKLKRSKKQSLACPECDQEFADMKQLGIHVLDYHRFDSSVPKINEIKKFECSMCMRSFLRRKSLISHIKTHEDKARRICKCEACGREFHHQAHLDNHIVLVHSKDNGLKCDKCSKNFATEELLNQHLEGHKKSKNVCSICNRYFTMLSSLTEHMRTHTGEKPFLCSICGKGFSQKNNMSQHMRRHQGLKPFKCEQCDRRFVSKGELESHTRRHSGAHPFICDECGNGFTTSSSLTKHRRIHSGERPYACDLCNMRFAVLGTLKNHRRTHTGEKPYQCSHCEKAFIQRQDLISHIRCHTGERPFICTCCGQGFRKTSALKVHIKIHGKDTMIMQ